MSDIDTFYAKIDALNASIQHLAALLNPTASRTLPPPQLPISTPIVLVPTPRVEEIAPPEAEPRCCLLVPHPENDSLILDPCPFENNTSVLDPPPTNDVHSSPSRPVFYCHNPVRPGYQDKRIKGFTIVPTPLKNFICCDRIHLLSDKNWKWHRMKITFDFII